MALDSSPPAPASGHPCQDTLGLPFQTHRFWKSATNPPWPTHSSRLHGQAESLGCAWSPHEAEGTPCPRPVQQTPRPLEMVRKGQVTPRQGRACGGGQLRPICPHPWFLTAPGPLLQGQRKKTHTPQTNGHMDTGAQHLSFPLLPSPHLCSWGVGPPPSWRPRQQAGLSSFHIFVT